MCLLCRKLPRTKKESIRDSEGEIYVHRMSECWQVYVYIIEANVFVQVERIKNRDLAIVVFGPWGAFLGRGILSYAKLVVWNDDALAGVVQGGGSRLRNP